jgi:isoquinoline 1-oxidoreductase alpha subunit
MTTFSINGKPVTSDLDPDMPLLWFLREQQRLTGTKFGCGIAQCGACTVHVNGQATRSCSVPIGSLAGASVTTIEGLTSPVARAVQNTWIDRDVVQCGYCQSGQIMSAVALLEKNPEPTDSDIDAAMRGNLCRCATYHRIRAAIHAAAAALQGDVHG